MEEVQKRKILVVGGCGYVGGALTDLLLSREDKWDVTVYDNLLYEPYFLKKVKFRLDPYIESNLIVYLIDIECDM